MVILNNPHPVNQLTAGGQFPGYDCGEACVVSLLFDAGHPEPIRAVEDYDARGGDLHRGTAGDVNAEFLSQHGVPAHVVNHAGYVAAALDRRHRVMSAIWSNHAGYPTPGSGLGHWVICYGYDAANYAIMNPIGGEYQTIPAAEFDAASQQYGVECDVVLPADGGAPTSVGDEPLNNSQKLAWARLGYLVLRGAEPDVKEYTGWASAIHDNGDNVDSILSQMVDTKEGRDHLTALLRAQDIARSPDIDTALQLAHDWKIPDTGWGARLGQLFAEVAALKAAPPPNAAVDPAQLSSAVNTAVQAALGDIRQLVQDTATLVADLQKTVSPPTS